MSTTRKNTNPDSSAGADEFTVMDGDHEDNPGFGPDALVVILEGSGADSADTCYCGCGEDTAKGSMYRQGHDARMKGKLIRAGRAGVEVVLVNGGGLISGDAASMASRFASSDGFVAMVMAGIERPAKSRKQPKDRAPKGAKADGGYGVTKVTTASLREATGEGQVEAKVGRWVYPGTVVDGEFVYTDKKGATKVAAAGKYTLQ